MIRFRYRGAGILFCIVSALIIMVSLFQKKSNEGDTEVLQSEQKVRVACGGAAMTMDMEDFIPLVLMGEMSDQSPKELIKAQAVIIRTYILYMMGGNQEISAQELGLPYKTPFQLKELWFSEEKLYRTNQLSGVAAQLFGLGKSRIYSERMRALKRVIAETEGNVLKIEGKLILPLFHEISNGKTRSGKEVLGEQYYYLKSAQCDSDMECANYEHYKEMTVTEILEALKKHRIVVFENGEESEQTPLSAKEFFAKMDCSHKDSAGYIQYFLLGDVKIDGNDFAESLGLKSCALDIEVRGEKLVFQTRGIGHGFGMSIHAAGEMAKKGETYDRILKNFYDAALVKNTNGGIISEEND